MVEIVQSENTGAERLSPLESDKIEQAFQDGLSLHQSGKIPEAQHAYRDILKARPDHALTLNYFGLSLFQAGDPEGAANLIAKAVRYAPQDDDTIKAVFLNNLGSAYGALRKADEAVECFRRALEIDPNFLLALDNLGNAMINEDQLDEAVACFKRMIEIDPGDESAYCKLASSLIDRGELDDGLQCLREALVTNPDFIVVRGNLGVALNERGEHDEAVACFRKVLEIDPNDAAAYCNLGVALSSLGKLDEAEEATCQAIRLDPDIQSAHTQLGFLLLRQEKIEDASEAILEPAYIFRQPGGDPLTTRKFDTFNRISRPKLHHDIEQLTYLMERDLLPVNEYGWLLDEYLEINAANPDLQETDLFELRPKVSDDFIAHYNRLLYYSPGEMIDGPTINPDLDTKLIQEAFFDSDPNLSLIEGLLTEEALSALRRFCLESTVWYNISAKTDVGANLEQGFVCPLLFQIATDIRRAFPKVFSELTLNSLWSFKYFEKWSGDKIHIDSGLRNLNVWITPDEANLDKATGGITFWNKLAPVLEVKDNPKQKTIDILNEIISEPDTIETKVAYGYNRAGIFEANIIHGAMDTIDFKPGYENHRINVTFVFGTPDY
ncbi:MAG: tetratricopeptide repeat protein [Rhodospirillaceae bacterium]|nr:tetratricopeptide repeat protein [Rhodospirillaceae bacterium]